MITRSDILGEAVHRCIRDMYLWSQPSIDIDELIKMDLKMMKRIHYIIGITYLQRILSI